MVNKISIIIGILIGATTLFGVGFKYDQRLAKAEDVNKSIQALSIRLDQKILEDRLNNIQIRMWKLEDRYGSDQSKMPIDARESYRIFCEQKELILRQLDLLKTSR